MIKLNRFNGKEIIINCDLIETIEITPDTVITLTTGKKIIVAESADEVIDKVIDYKKRTLEDSLK